MFLTPESTVCLSPYEIWFNSVLKSEKDGATLVMIKLESRSPQRCLKSAPGSPRDDACLVY